MDYKTNFCFQPNTCNSANSRTCCVSDVAFLKNYAIIVHSDLSNLLSRYTEKHHIEYAITEMQNNRKKMRKFKKKWDIEAGVF